MSLSCIVFDCDGVLIDSVPVKTHAFAHLAKPYGSQAVERLVSFHNSHGGVSRFEKFAWFFQNVLGRPISEEESKDFGERFARFCEEELRRCPLIPGALDVLKKWHGLLPLFVCSGAPAHEQQAILKEHGLDTYFNGIFGAPPAKAELLAQILRKAGIAPENALMVGDATTDRDAANATGTKFYGVGDLLKGGPYPWGPDLTELSSYIEELR